jgi:hypothetical protein
MEFILKAIISGVLVATISTVAQRNSTLAALLMGIPFTALLSMIFMYYSNVDAQVLVNFSFETIYFVAISLLFFVMFGMLLPVIGFWYSVILGFVTTAIAYNILLMFIGE